MNTWEIALVVVILLPILTFIMWQFHLIMPIYLAATFKQVQKYYKDQWAGEDTARFIKKTSKGSLWWGYNCRTRGEFIIFNGKSGQASWQIQNWRPRVAIWGVAMPWDFFRREKVITDMDEQKMYQLPESKLGRLPKDHPMRGKLEDDLKRSVRDQIAEARQGHFDAISLLHESLHAKPYQWVDSFALWIACRGILIGIRNSYRIGTAVCTELGFTIQEADHLYSEYMK